MTVAAFLLTLSQIAVTLAGLVGIMVAFTAGNGKLSPSDSLRARVIIIVSIYTALFSLLPLALLSVSAVAPYAWSASTVFYLLFFVIFAITQRRHELQAGKLVVKDIKGIHRQVAWCTMPFVFLLSLINLSPLFGAVQPGLYALALLLFMFIGALVFIGLIAQRLL